MSKRILIFFITIFLLSCENNNEDYIKEILFEADYGAGDGGGCTSGCIKDCNGNCAPSGWLGDGSCDDYTYISQYCGGDYADFNCSEFNYDNGDCDNGG